MDNDAFRDNAWYFRNALVRANYADYARKVSRDWSYLEIFFRNLLLGEKDEMKSRYLLIGLTDADKQKIRELTEGARGQKKVVRKSGQKNTQKTTQKSSPNATGELTEKLTEKLTETEQKIVVAIMKDGNITQGKLANKIGIARTYVTKVMGGLQSRGVIRRVGPDKCGHWEVI